MSEKRQIHILQNLESLRSGDKCSSRNMSKKNDSGSSDVQAQPIEEFSEAKAPPKVEPLALANRVAAFKAAKQTAYEQSEEGLLEQQMKEQKRQRKERLF